MVKSCFYLKNAILVLTLLSAPERALRSRNLNLGAVPDSAAAAAAPKATGLSQSVDVACPIQHLFGVPALLLATGVKRMLHFLFQRWNYIYKVSWVSSSKQTCLPLWNTRGSISNGEKGARTSKPVRSKTQQMKELFFYLCKNPEQQDRFFFFKFLLARVESSWGRSA